jgi:myo-inositol 2-dehydrogenase/D-chiro-inositol 1-dehydrogenase
MRGSATTAAREHARTNPSGAPLGVGVIGAGRIGSTHARLLAGEVPGAHVAAVNDARPEVARALGAELGVLT